MLQSLGSQWRVLQTGHTIGLHYEVLPGVLQLLGVPAARRQDVFWALRHMEAELVPWFNRDRK